MSLTFLPRPPPGTPKCHGKIRSPSPEPEPPPGVTEICASPPPLLPETPQCVGGVGNIPFTSVTNVSMIKSAPSDIPDPPQVSWNISQPPSGHPGLGKFRPPGYPGVRITGHLPHPTQTIAKHQCESLGARAVDLGPGMRARARTDPIH